MQNMATTEKGGIFHENPLPADSPRTPHPSKYNENARGKNPDALRANSAFRKRYHEGFFRGNAKKNLHSIAQQNE